MMTYQVPKSVVDQNKGIYIYDSGSTDHRGLVVRTTCDLENDLAQVLFAHFRRCNGNVTWERAAKELFSESGLLCSLGKMTKIAVYLGLVSEQEAHDLRQLGRLRNMYAHGRGRDQFNRDSKAASIVKQLFLCKNSAAVFDGLEVESIYLGCTTQLRTILTQRAQEKFSGAA